MSEGIGRGTIIVVMLLTIGLVGSSTFGILKAQEITVLQSRINELEFQNTQLQTQVAHLEGNLSESQSMYYNLFVTYSDLFKNYTDLQSLFDELMGNYTDLQDQYQELLDDYSDLFADYEALQSAFEDPLTNPVIPTIGDVRNWLEQDNTDQHEYVEDVWMCGDYAAMLMTRAKTMNWRVRICTMHYSFDDESGYGSTTDVYGDHGHAFNMIVCEDGIWYIEPQSDATWYIVTGGGTRTTFNIHTYYDFTSSTRATVWQGRHWWSNFYGYFG